jgi:hypothetical protein
MEVGCDGRNALAPCDCQDRAGMLHLEERPAPTAGNALERPNIGWGKNQRARPSTAHGKSSVKNKKNPFTILALLISCRTS